MKQQNSLSLIMLLVLGNISYASAQDKLKAEAARLESQTCINAGIDDSYNCHQTTKNELEEFDYTRGLIGNCFPEQDDRSDNCQIPLTAPKKLSKLPAKKITPLKSETPKDLKIVEIKVETQSDEEKPDIAKNSDTKDKSSISSKESAQVEVQAQNDVLKDYICQKRLELEELEKRYRAKKESTIDDVYTKLLAPFAQLQAVNQTIQSSQFQMAPSHFSQNSQTYQMMMIQNQQHKQQMDLMMYNHQNSIQAMFHKSVYNKMYPEHEVGQKYSYDTYGTIAEPGAMIPYSPYTYNFDPAKEMHWQNRPATNQLSILPQRAIQPINNNNFLQNQNLRVPQVTQSINMLPQVNMQPVSRNSLINDKNLIIPSISDGLN